MGIQPNRDHQTSPNASVLIQIDIKFASKTVTLKITEDLSSQWPLNFYDIQNQILNQFKKFQHHIIPLNKGSKEDDHSSLIEALEFKVKRELQS
jgi:hypothetical protein